MENRLLQEINSTDVNPEVYKLTVDPGSIHYLMMVIVWIVATNIGLWSQAFKQYHWANYVHIFAMGTLTLVTWLSGFLALLAYGLQTQQIDHDHVKLGIAIMVILILQSILGLISFICQRNAKIRPDIVTIINFIHRIFGWLVLLLALIQILKYTFNRNNELFIPTAVISLTSYVAFLLLKIFRPSMQSYQKISQQSDAKLPIVDDLSAVAKYKGDYFIFADKVYDLNKVITNHPGGYQVIKNIRGREVDRFIYGSQALQSVEKMYTHSHSASSITMAGQPIGYLSSICPYQNMNEVNEVAIKTVSKQYKISYMYIAYIKSTNKKFIFKGYENLSQFGKYHTVTIDNKITRLYTAVNFLQQTNLELMSKIMGKTFIQYRQTTQIISSQRIDPQSDFNGCVPLAIKLYDQGKFTKNFLGVNYNKNFVISKPRGRGLSLHEMLPGQLVFFATGTGINPFCDLIDMMYKQHLVSQQTLEIKQILEKNPIARTKILLSKFRLTLYLSICDPDDLHEITVYQMHQLCKNKIMKAYMRIQRNSQPFFKKYSYFKKIEKYFKDYVSDIVSNLYKISQVYICGQPTMSKSLVQCFGDHNIPIDKYRVM